MSNSSFWPINTTLSGATTPSQSGARSDGNEGVLCISQRSSITRVSLSDDLMSYAGHSLRGMQICILCILQPQPTRPQNTRWGVGVLLLYRHAVGVFYSPSQLGHRTLAEVWGSYSSTEMQSVYSTATADWINREKNHHTITENAFLIVGLFF